MHNILLLTSVCSAHQVGRARGMLTILLGQEGLVHTCKAFTSHHLTLDPHSTSAAAALANYTAMAKLVAAVPTQGTANAWPFNVSESAGWCQYDPVQSEADLVTLPRSPDLTRQLHEADKHMNFGDATRGQAVQRFEFLIQLVLGQLFTPDEGSTLQQRNWPVLDEKFIKLLTALYGTACGRLIADPACSNMCGTLHIKAFGRAYTAKTLKLCSLHLSALQAMARHKVR